MADTITLRALNRATLARQLLLAREKLPVLAVIERLVGLQAQWPRPPHIGLWTRIPDFRPDDLLRPLREREAVRVTSLRGTLHMMSAKDFVPVRAALQSALDDAARGVLRARALGMDADALVREGRTLFLAGPRPFDAVRDDLAARHPRADVRAMAYLIRIGLRLVQVPTDDRWGFPTNPEFALAETWLGGRTPKAMDGATLARRYLAAFGPATPADLKTWCGLPLAAAKAAFAELEGELVSLRDDRKRTWLDLRKAPRPGEDAAAPPRFLPEFDNLLLGHADRRRFIDDAHRGRVFLPGLRVAPTFLLDGFVAGTWGVERSKDTATLTVRPFATIPRADRTALAAEAQALARLVEADARRFDVRFEKAG